MKQNNTKDYQLAKLIKKQDKYIILLYLTSTEKDGICYSMIFDGKFNNRVNSRHNCYANNVDCACKIRAKEWEQSGEEFQVKNNYVAYFEDIAKRDYLNNVKILSDKYHSDISAGIIIPIDTVKIQGEYSQAEFTSENGWKGIKYYAVPYNAETETYIDYLPDDESIKRHIEESAAILKMANIKTDFETLKQRPYIGGYFDGVVYLRDYIQNNFTLIPKNK